jgi:hypothetical protein
MKHIITTFVLLLFLQNCVFGYLNSSFNTKDSLKFPSENTIRTAFEKIDIGANNHKDHSTWTFP